MNSKDRLPFDFGNTIESPPRSIGAEMLHQIRVSVVAVIVMTVVCCGIYPLIVWGLAQTLFPHKANGSLITREGAPTPDARNAIGSALLGQAFTEAKYFHARPSAAGAGYDPTATGGSNLGPLSAKLLNGVLTPSTQPSVPATVAYDGVKLRTLLYAQTNGIEIAESSQPLANFLNEKGAYDQARLIAAFNDSQSPLTFRTAQPIPADAVTASASGLDPHISLANALVQATRVAKVRGMSVERVRELISQNTEGPDLGIFGDAGVNVLKLNLALDNAQGTSAK